MLFQVALRCSRGGEKLWEEACCFFAWSVYVFFFVWILVLFEGVCREDGCRISDTHKVSAVGIEGGEGDRLRVILDCQSLALMERNLCGRLLCIE